jgi:hypothetical protein
MAIAPNCQRVVEALAKDYPHEFADCHKPDLGDRAWAFIKRVAWVLHSTVDVRFGLNGKRGNTSDPSMDAVSFRNPASAAGGVEVIDVVGGAGAPGARPGWFDVTDATVRAGTVGAYIQPQPVTSNTKDPVVVVTPPDDTHECACNISSDEVDAVLSIVADIARHVERHDARNEERYLSLVQHIDDVKGRIERVSQELANKPAGDKCRLRW